MRTNFILTFCTLFIGLVLYVSGVPIGENENLQVVNVTLEDSGDETPHIIHLAVKVLPEEKKPSDESEDTDEEADGRARPPIVNLPSCIVMFKDDADIYRQFGCNMTELLPECYKKPECPDACTAADGSVKEHNGPMWPEQEGKKMCECVTWHQILASPPLPPPGAVPWPPYKHCQDNGCTLPGNDTLIEPGSNVDLYGRPCVCVRGPDPNLMDYATLYHLKCTGSESGEAEGYVSEEIDEK